MSVIRDILDVFGVSQTPWVMRIYIVLLLIFVGLLVGVMNDIPDKAPKDHHTMQVFDLAMDSIKIILGAVIGSLSMAAQWRWGAGAARDPADGGE